MIGIDPESDGLKRANERGYLTFTNGIDEIIENPGDCRNCFRCNFC